MTPLSSVIVRAGSRYRSTQPGIESWHCFSAGAHYDPANVAFGSLVGVDEHLVAPGAGFEWHAHHGVVIVSHVLDGVLRHEDCAGDCAGAPRLVRPGELLTQDARDGVRHREINASDDASLGFVQVTTLAPLIVDVLRGPVRLHALHVHLFVVRGQCRLADGELLGPGDALRASGGIDLARADEVLVTVEGGTSAQG